jgi:FtsP/CotA-like multicopper oxidase with cupredoxin domain
MELDAMTSISRKNERRKMIRRQRRTKRLLLSFLGSGVLLATGLPFTASPAASATLAKTGMICTNGTLDTVPTPDVRTFTLKTSSGYVYMPDGNTVFMWGFADPANPDPNLASFQSPGPALCANQGEDVVVNLTNELSEAVSIVFPGQGRVTSTGGSGSGLFTNEAAAQNASGTDEVSYRFNAGQPGTYVYESGTNPAKQVEMGLYGVLVIRPANGSQFAYNAARTEFDPTREHILLLAEIDPDIHLAVERGDSIDVTKRHPRYFTVNGRAFPDSIYDNFVPWLPNQPYGSLVRVRPVDLTAGKPALIRYANAGLLNHPFHPHGNHMTVIARDGRLLQGPGGQDTSFQDFTRTVGAGQTYDLLFQWLQMFNPGAGRNGQNWLNNSGTNPSGSNKIPVTLPSYRNLMFADNVTFYSGNPYLGYKGTLPTVVTSFNVCGEYYFPWHSHALNEFVNFDEGFGGMATMVRVDPPNGVSISPSGKQCK